MIVVRCRNEYVEDGEWKRNELTLNHIEIKNDCEKFEFLEMFEKGIFKDEAEKSISYVQNFS